MRQHQNLCPGRACGVCLEIAATLLFWLTCRSRRAAHPG